MAILLEYEHTDSEAWCKGPASMALWVMPGSCDKGENLVLVYYGGVPSGNVTAGDSSFASAIENIPPDI